MPVEELPFVAARCQVISSGRATVEPTFRCAELLALLSFVSIIMGRVECLSADYSSARSKAS